MSVIGRWRIVAMPDYVGDYRDMMEPAYIEFADDGSGEFAFGCVTGQIFGPGDGNNVSFSWQGNDEMDEAQGNGRAEIQPDGSINGQICFHGGDEADFVAHKMDFFNRWGDWGLARAQIEGGCSCRDVRTWSM
jgi:hypothetical protein